MKYTYLNNVRSFLVFLVVVYHCGLVYESSGVGASFWIVDDHTTNHLSGIINLIIDTFVMSSMFFVAGFFAVSSLAKQSPFEFLYSKIKRLILPWCIAVLILIPIYKYIFLASRGLEQENWESYFHFSNGIFSQSWLWFLPVLFLFFVFYALLCHFRVNRVARRANLSVTKVAILIFLVSVLSATFIKVYGFAGWIKTPFIDFQIERLIIYFCYFLFGAFVFEADRIDDWLENKVAINVANFTSWLPMTLYVSIVIYSLIKPEDFLISKFGDELVKQVFFHWTLMILLFSCLVTCKKYFNRDTKVSRLLAQNSFSVYIIHTVVLGFIAMLLQTIELPSLLKNLILVLLTFLVCQLLASFYYKMKYKQLRNN